MHQQISTQRPSPKKMVEEEEESLDTQPIAGKNKRNIEALAYMLYEQRGRGMDTIWMIGSKRNGELLAADKPGDFKTCLGS